MYSIGVNFLTAKNREYMDNAELVVQTEWPHLVGRVQRFNRIEREEQRRITTVKRWEEVGIEYAQVEGKRIYVEHVGALQDVGKSYIGKRFNTDGAAYVQDVLYAMADYVLDNMTEGQRYAYSEDLPIVPDNYFKEIRKIKRGKVIPEGNEI